MAARVIHIIKPDGHNFNSDWKNHFILRSSVQKSSYLLRKIAGSLSWEARSSLRKVPVDVSRFFSTSKSFSLFLSSTLFNLISLLSISWQGENTTANHHSIAQLTGGTSWHENYVSTSANPSIIPAVRGPCPFVIPSTADTGSFTWCGSKLALPVNGRMVGNACHSIINQFYGSWEDRF